MLCIYHPASLPKEEKSFYLFCITNYTVSVQIIITDELI